MKIIEIRIEELNNGYVVRDTWLRSGDQSLSRYFPTKEQALMFASIYLDRSFCHDVDAEGVALRQVIERYDGAKTIIRD